MITTPQRLLRKAPNRNLFDPSICGVVLNSLPFGNIPEAVQVVASSIGTPIWYSLIDTEEFSVLLQNELTALQPMLYSVYEWHTADTPNEIEVTEEGEVTTATTAGARTVTRKSGERITNTTHKTTVTSNSSAETEPATTDTATSNEVADTEEHPTYTDTTIKSPVKTTKYKQLTPAELKDRESRASATVYECLYTALRAAFNGSACYGV